MASSPYKRVRFVLPPTFSRQASSTEIAAATNFVNHFENCSTCGLAIFWQGLARLDTYDLCSAGRSAAHHVSRQLVYIKGHIYSTIETEQDQEQETRIEIPSSLQSVRLLLKAMSHERLQDLCYQTLPQSTYTSRFFSYVRPSTDRYSPRRHRVRVSLTDWNDY